MTRRDDEVEMWYVEYTDHGFDRTYPEGRGRYVARPDAEEFIEALPYEQQMTAVVQQYDPFAS